MGGDLSETRQRLEDFPGSCGGLREEGQRLAGPGRDVDRIPAGLDRPRFAHPDRLPVVVRFFTVRFAAARAGGVERRESTRCAAAGEMNTDRTSTPTLGEAYQKRALRKMCIHIRLQILHGTEPNIYYVDKRRYEYCAIAPFSQRAYCRFAILNFRILLTIRKY